VVHQFTPGNFRDTSGQFDLAIDGKGFFQLNMPDGTIGYTRDGAFSIDQNGTLVNAAGYELNPQITVPQDALDVTVARDGTVTVTQPGQALPQEIGQITLVNFINPAGLNHIGGNILLQTQASGDPIEGAPGGEGLGRVVQGFLEMSNVDIADEMVNMIVGQRAYEANSKTIRTIDDMLSVVTNLKR
jgi:flagellar basal-body rod protein FlgG